MAQKITVGVIGTGLMGAPMATHISNNNKERFNVLVWNRSVDKAQAVVEQTKQHVQLASTVHQLVTEMVTILTRFNIAPEEIRQLKKEFNLVQFVECPVLGSTPVAIAAKLQVMICCDTTSATSNNNDTNTTDDDDDANNNAINYDDNVEHILSSCGTTKYISNNIGDAASVKLALNQIIASQTASFALSIAMIQKSNIDPQIFMDIVRKGPFMSPYFDFKYPQMMDRSWNNVAFPTTHLLKDVNLMKSFADTLSIPTDYLQGLAQSYSTAVEKGFGSGDFSAVLEAFAPNDATNNNKQEKE